MENYEILDKVEEKDIVTTYFGKNVSNYEKVLVQKITCVDPDEVASKLQVLLKLKHENLVKYYDIIPEVNPPALSESNCVYVIKSCCMEFETLENLIQREFISDEIYLNFTIQIAEGLRYIHKNGLVHGEIQPRKIYVDFDNNLIIDDFNFYGLINELIHRDSIYGNLNYLAPEVNEFCDKTFESDMYSFASLLYKLARKERIERRWSIYLSSEIDAYSMIPHDVSWVSLRGFINSLDLKRWGIYYDKKKRPSPEQVIELVKSIQESKSLNKVDFFKYKYLEKEKKFLMELDRYEKHYYNVVDFKVDQTKLKFEYKHMVSEFLDSQKTIVHQFKKFTSGRSNLFFCDEVCDFEEYWNDLYESNSEWRLFVDESRKKGIDPPQSIFRLAREHFICAVQFFDDCLKYLDNTDPENASFKKFSTTGNEMKRRIKQNIDARKYSKHINVLKQSKDSQIKKIMKNPFNHVSHSFKVTMQGEEYIMLVLYDLNEGGIALVPRDCKDEILMFHLGASLPCQTMFGYFFETLEKGHLQNRIISMKNEDSLVLGDFITRFKSRHFNKFDQRYVINYCMNSVLLDTRLFSDDMKFVFSHNEDFFNYLFENKKKDKFDCIFDLKFSFK